MAPKTDRLNNLQSVVVNPLAILELSPKLRIVARLVSFLILRTLTARTSIASCLGVVVEIKLRCKKLNLILISWKRARPISLRRLLFFEEEHLIFELGGVAIFEVFSLDFSLALLEQFVVVLLV